EAIAAQRGSGVQMEAVLEDLLQHTSPDVRLEALRRIEARGPGPLLDKVAALVTSETDTKVAARALRVLATTAEDEEAEPLYAYLHAGEERPRRAIMTGFLASGSID